MKGRNRQSGFACLFAAVAALPIATAATGQTFYRVTNLTATLGTGVGFEPGPDDRFGLNNAGEAAFTVKVAVEGQPQTKKHAFVWLPQTNYGLPAGLHDLHTLAGLGLADESAAHDISANGFVAGQLSIDGESLPRALVWQLGPPVQTIDLTQFSSPPEIIQPRDAWAVSDAAQPVVVGVAEGNVPPCFNINLAFRTTLDGSNVLFALEPVPGDEGSVARDVNPTAGAAEAVPLIVGYSGLTCSGDDVCLPGLDAVRWQPVVAVLSDLGPQGSEGRGTNTRNQAVGWGYQNPNVPCFLMALFWEPPLFGFFNLGALPELIGFQTQAEAINNPDEAGRIQVVGSNETTGHILLWERPTPMSTWTVIDVNDFLCEPCSDNWVIVDGHDINDSGWVIAVADGDPDAPGLQPYAVLLTPLASCPVFTCLGDINGDGCVNPSDLAILLTAWGLCPAGDPCPADLNCDGHVDSDDLAILLTNWCPCENGNPCPDCVGGGDGEGGDGGSDEDAGWPELEQLLQWLIEAGQDDLAALLQEIWEDMDAP